MRMCFVVACVKEQSDVADINGGLHSTRRLAFVGGLCKLHSKYAQKLQRSRYTLNMSRAHLVSSTQRVRHIQTLGKRVKNCHYGVLFVAVCGQIVTGALHSEFI